MNPNENNPVSPTGASGATGAAPGATPSSSTPSAIDFTGNSLSMNDSLASAKDNLTSAGQAVGSTSNTMGLDQLGANNPTASMETPNEPLVPADPVPGSIGSVTSVPPLKTAEPAPTFTPLTTSAMPVMGGASTAAAASTNPTPSTSGTGYFNPFATRSNTSTPNPTPAQSSTAVPPALQPQGEKFSNSLGLQNAPKAKTNIGNIMMIVGWALAIIATILAVFFFIQWQDAEKRANEKEIVYLPSTEPDDSGNQNQVSSIKCTQYLGGEGIEGIENMVDRNRTVVISYITEGENNNLDNITLTEDYSFTDGAAAEAARWYFDGIAMNLGNTAAELGVDALGSNVEITENVLHHTLSGNATQIIGENVNTLMLNYDENGNALLDPENVQRAYEEKGFTCTAE